MHMRSCSGKPAWQLGWIQPICSLTRCISTRRTGSSTSPLGPARRPTILSWSYTARCAAPTVGDPSALWPVPPGVKLRFCIARQAPSSRCTCPSCCPTHAQGNVILTDGRYEVLTLLRSHRDDARGIATMPRHPYPLHSIRLAQPVTAERWAEATAAANDAATLRSACAVLAARCVSSKQVSSVKRGVEKGLYSGSCCWEVSHCHRVFEGRPPQGGCCCRRCAVGRAAVWPPRRGPLPAVSQLAARRQGRPLVLLRSLLLLQACANA
jgi:hypothetical protein